MYGKGRSQDLTERRGQFFFEMFKFACGEARWSRIAGKAIFFAGRFGVCATVKYL